MSRLSHGYCGLVACSLKLGLGSIGSAEPREVIDVHEWRKMAASME
jgi:hypothetical protein